jgi:hypothetical protein
MKSEAQSTSVEAIGEVLSSSITEVIAQTWSKEEPHLENPRFGSFLKIDSHDTGLQIFVVVYNVVTRSPDTVHKPWALGLSREQLRLEQPHIFALLRTEIHAAIVGYTDEKRFFQHLPPHPPDVHDFVFPATRQEVLSLTESFDFLRLLLLVSAVPSDELLSATIREAYQMHNGDYAFLVSAGQALSQLLHNDYDRLVSLLKKIRPDQH